MRQVLLEKPLPSNVEAEQVVLGVILLSNETIEQAQARLVPGDFSREVNRIIFAKMLAIHARGDEINPLTLQDELHRAGDLELVGGMAYVASLFDGVPRFSNIEPYVNLVKNAANLRRLIYAGDAITTRAFDDEMPVDEQLRAAEQELFAISDERAEGHWQDIAGVACDVIVEADERAKSGRPVLDLSTGFRDLDYVTDGLERGTMVVIGAAPKMGKTALALSFTRRMSESEENRQQDGRPPVIAWFSMEMPVKQQAQRLLSSQARVEMRRLRTGQLNPEERRRVEIAAQQMAGWRVHFDDRTFLSPRAMRDAIRRLKREEGRVDVMIVDYIQLGDGERQKGETRENEVAKVSRGILQIAKDYNLVAITLSQLNRALFSRADKRPNLGDFRDSGQIGQDAYAVIGLHREEVYNPETEKQNVAELVLLAQRNGPLATVEVAFMPQVMRFEDLYRPGDDGYPTF